MRKLIVATSMLALLVAPAGAAAKPSNADVKKASQECRAERDALGADAFKEEYGTGKNGKNAFGKCVSKTVKENPDDDRDDDIDDDDGETEDTDVS